MLTLLSLRTWLVLGTLALGATTAVGGPIVAAVALGLICAAVLLQRPMLLLFALILYEPLESLLVARLPQTVRSLDEGLIVLLFVLVLALDLFRGGLSRLFRHFLLVPTVLFVLVSAVSGLVNEAPALITALGIFVTVDYALLALLIGCVRVHSFDLRRIYKLIFFVSALVCLATLTEVALGMPLVGQRWTEKTLGFALTRYHGPFEHPNDLANFMVFPISLGIGLLFYPVDGIRRVRGWLILFLVFFLLAVGRVAWISLFAGFVVFLAIHHWKRFAGVFLRLLPLLVLFSPILYFGLASRIGYTLQRGDARLYFIRHSMPLIREHPLLGVGPGRFGGVVAARYASEVQHQYGIDSKKRAWLLGSVDNFWLHLLGETGLLGTASFLLLLGAVLRVSHRKLRQAPRGHPVLPLAASCFVLTIYEVLYNVSSPALEDNTLIAYYWLLVGLLASVSAANGDEAPASS
jgi:O-antigen ligase